MRVTSIILTYNRQKNLPKIIDALKKQTVENDIIVWDNADNLEKIDGVTLIRSSKNFICRPRFILCGLVNTDYIFNLDDDHLPVDDSLFDKLIAESKEYDDEFFIGWKACKEYRREPKADGLPADLVNTGVSFYHSKLANRLLMNPYRGSNKFKMTEDEYKYADDHWVSAQMGQCRTSLILDNGVMKIDDCGHGLSMEGKHIPIRQTIARRFW